MDIGMMGCRICSRPCGAVREGGGKWVVRVTRSMPDWESVSQNHGGGRPWGHVGVSRFLADWTLHAQWASEALSTMSTDQGSTLLGLVFMVH